MKICLVCGEDVRRPTPDEADQYIEWVHDATGSPVADDGWYDEEAQEWHDPHWAVA